MFITEAIDQPMHDGLAYILYSLCWRVIRWLPEKLAYFLARKLGSLLVKRDIKPVKQLRMNLAKVAPQLNAVELEELVVEGMQISMRYWFDTFRFSDWDTKKIRKNVEIVNSEFIFGPIRQGKGVIVALPHAGNWDHAGAFFCTEDLKLVTVVEHVKPEKLFRKFLAHRMRMGMEALDIDARVFAKLAQALREGKLIALVADRDLSKSGIAVNFFGATAQMPTGPAVLALQTGCDLITAYTSYTKNGLKIEFEAPITIPKKDRKEQIAEITQACADRFAKNIAKNPSNWHMLQRVWIN